MVKLRRLLLGEERESFHFVDSVLGEETPLEDCNRFDRILGLDSRDILVEEDPWVDRIHVVEEENWDRNS